ncbi:N(4)-(Beta-N-acetylglucosaminyl)-L-asparaginase-like [Toxorhynchites rutilus septentrionalis]|uniref:N(4)-(Beta-N-acetylglucosaminyl)-L-asparaginase- like n=1 Tax=Toxorhynchites rutilus septentrionalis TaxID=329112 RepID=UPI002479B954|nr:N(4)-(Beta-N-acetylglucosaminyl)-L-asparaginase-like [Toxorhynchites rutilus septentrionalis]XP_055631265.1 N(4)-(Beta-N-acetylglucosaminyl)-L-asparaginase-like [Toxorhynchites rutilus septentrionalis]
MIIQRGMASPGRIAGICVFSIVMIAQVQFSRQGIPLVVNTWGFQNATLKAYHSLIFDKLSAIDALIEGCSVCEREQCDGTVGYGGSPDENGETTLDAMVMDGNTMNVGAVAAMRNIKHAIAVARHVLENTKHTLLVGSRATEFAVMMGFHRESLQTKRSREMWEEWKNNHCQPNFWTNVIPSPSMSCGPYEPISANSLDSKFWSSPTNNVDEQQKQSRVQIDRYNHDTIGMIVLDSEGRLAAGTSTNGARNKIPGRVGDSPIPGSGAYADASVGAAAATGDGDVMMRFLPSFLAVELLRQGVAPSESGKAALARIVKHYPSFQGGIVVATKDGQYGAACHGLIEFPYSVVESVDAKVVVKTVKCT